MTSQTRSHPTPKAAPRAINILALLAAILNLSINASSHQQTGRDVRALDPGKPVEREIAGGQTHYYKVTLTRGQYIRVVADQRGIDLTVAFVEPDGRKIAEIDRPGAWGVEALSAIAEASGVYQFFVQPAEGNALTARYEVRIEEMRTATPRDEDRVAAERAFAEGSRLKGEGKKDSLERALEAYQRALALWLSFGDRREEACTLNQIGAVYDSQGDKRKALDHYNRALLLIRSEKDRGGEALTLKNIGSVYRVMGDKGKAEEYLTQSLSIWRETGDRAGEAQTLNNLGILYNSTGESQKAIDSYNLSLSISRETGDLYLQGQTLSNIGALYRSLGDMQKALDYFNQALPLRRAARDRTGEAYTLNNTGMIYRLMGQMQKAIDCYNQALAIWRETGDRYGEAMTMGNIGVVYHYLGDLSKAIEFHSQALSLRRALGDRPGEAYTLNNLGQLQARMGDSRKGLEMLDQAIAIFQSTGNLSAETATLFAAAGIERTSGNFDRARSRLEAAIANVELLRQRVVSPDERASFFATAQRCYEAYINVLMSLEKMRPSEGHIALALEASERTRARNLIDLLAETRANIREGVDKSLLESERLLKQSLNEKAEEQMRLLTGEHTREQAEAMAKEIADLTSRFREAQAQIRIRSPRYGALTQPRPLNLKEIQQQLLDGTTALLEYSLGQQSSHLWVVTQAEIRGFELPRRSEIESAARLVYDLLTARNRGEKSETPQQRQSRLAETEARYKEAATKLGQMLLSQAAPLLGDKRLLIVADGALQYVPYAALPSTQSSKDGYRPLIMDHEIISLPSVSVLAVLRNEAAYRRRATKLVAAIADPVFEKDDPRLKSIVGHPRVGVRPDSDFESSALASSAREVGLADAGARLPRLPFTKQEAVAIMSLAPRSQRKLAVDFEASKKTATSAALSQYRIIHFATHGLLNSAHPELSGLVLSLVDERGQRQDGFLRLHEIYNLKLAADLVVLSACRTGLGKEIKGEGLIGLTRGFMYAGSARVMASLWKVDDEATAELMKQFYARLLKEGQTPAAALRGAQMSLLNQKDWQSPYYWAAFVMQGEWK
ncbi:MAG: CHAT domain-containing tetratricopeptide repeat protein [Acidobacteriota bacterium]